MTGLHSHVYVYLILNEIFTHSSKDALGEMLFIHFTAIREDRARGGRSSYEGCSPHGRPKSSSTDKEPAPRKVLHIRQQQQQQPATSVLSTVANTVTVDTVQDLGNTVVISSGKLSKIEEVTSHVQPVTPQLLEDLSAVESLMMEEEEEHACCAGKLQPGDTHLFSSLLHIADHCLYKIVRWARNLPDFANVSVGILALHPSL